MSAADSPESDPPGIVLDDVTVLRGDVRVLDRFSLTVPRGEVCALLGASGAGKSTALRVVAGLVNPTSGGVWLGGERAAGAGCEPRPPEQRSVGVVFQDLALFPHLDVAANIRFGAGGVDVEAELDRVRLSGFASRSIDGLSGGEQQRVAIARALARPAAVLLLDEPLSQVDGPARRPLRRAVVDAVRGAHAACLWVTHDPEEALEVADRLAVVQAGRVAQFGTPREVYEAPVSRAVAAATGQVAFVPCEPLDGEPGAVAAALSRAPSADREGAAWLAVRPGSLRLSADGIPGTVVANRFAGDRPMVDVALPAGTFAVPVASGSMPPVGAAVTVRVVAPVAMVRA